MTQVKSRFNPPTYFNLPNGNFFLGSFVTRLLLSYMKSHHNSILDVGCGPGIQLEFFKSRGMEVVGCDISFSAKSACVSKGLDFTVVDLNDEELQLPYSNDSFDVVMCNHTLEHVKTPALVVREMVRVAKDLACFIVPAGESYMAPEHIHFWNSTATLAQGLLRRNWTFSIEVVIDKPADTLAKYGAFIACIYKTTDSSVDLVEVLIGGGEDLSHHPIYVHIGE